MPQIERNLESRLLERDITRRQFMKFCSAMAAILALPVSLTGKVEKAVAAAKRPPVIWVEFQDCAGCTESFLRSSHPTVGEIVLDVLSVDYHETIMAAAGHQAEAAKTAAANAGGHLVVVEGSIPLNEGGAYCTVGGRTAKDILAEVTENAVAVIAVGSCASFGGLPGASPNPTGAVPASDLVTHIPVLNLPGCPVNGDNITATIVHYLTFGELPAMDQYNRPLFAYGALIHDNCERRGHFDAGEFARQWGDEGHRNGWCLYKLGCKGPITHHNCPALRWNGGTSWPVRAGHGCIGCSEPDFWEWPKYTPVELQKLGPPTTYPSVEGAPDAGVSAGSAAAVGVVAGAIIGAAGAVAIGRNRQQAAADEAEG